MLRRLANQYRWRVPVAIRSTIEDALFAPAARLLYPIVKHKDLAFFDARHLVSRGRHAKANALYSEQRETSDHAEIVDPLFSCRFTDRKRDTIVGSKGSFHIEFCYVGLKILASISIQSSHVNILINGRVIRRQQLNYRNSRAEVLFAIKRDVIATFPTNAAFGIQFDDGTCLASDTGQSTIDITVPHGNNTLWVRIDSQGLIDKKGNFPPRSQDVARIQSALLSLYQEASKCFQAITGEPLIIVCGTLLGQHRNGAFIDGDDDFDVGYFSKHVNPAAVKLESIRFASALMKAGFHIYINRSGMPFRIVSPDLSDEIYLDVTPIFADGQDGTLLRKLTRLDFPLLHWQPAEISEMEGTTVWKPANADDFLRSYYGADWQIPKPDFSYNNRPAAPHVVRQLQRTYLTVREQKTINARLLSDGLGHKFVPLLLRKPYPIPNDFEF